MRLGLLQYNKKIELFEEAIKSYRIAQNLDQTNPKYANNLGFSLMQIGNCSSKKDALAFFEEAIVYFNKAIDINSKHTEAYYNLGVVNLFIYKNIDDETYLQSAMAGFLKAEELNQECSYDLMTIFSLLKDKENAIVFLKRYLAAGKKTEKIELIISNPDLSFIVIQEEFKNLSV